MSASAGDDSSRTPRASERAITDVFDEDQRIVLVENYNALLRRLTIVGIIAIVITGLFGYDLSGGELAPTVPTVAFWDLVFGKPWVLFGFFGLLIFTVQGLVLRNPALARFRRRMQATTLISMAVVALVYLAHTELGALLNTVLQHLRHTNLGQFIKDRLEDSATWLVLDLLVLAVIFGQAALGWRRYKAGKLFSSQIDLRAGLPSTGRPIPLSGQEQEAGVSELVAGDLILRALLTFGVALLFTNAAITGIAGSLDSAVSGQLPCIDVVGTCSATVTAVHLWELDVFIGGVVLAGGLFLLAFLVQNEAAKLMARAREGETVDPINVGQEIFSAVLDIVLSPFNRQPRSRIGRRVNRSVQASILRLTWPALVLAAVAGAGGLAHWGQIAIQCPKFWELTPAVAALRGRCQLPSVVGRLELGYLWHVSTPILVSAVAAFLGTILAFGAMLGDWHVSDNTRKFLSWTAFSNTPVLAIIGLALIVANWAALFGAQLFHLQRIPPNASLLDWMSGIHTLPRQHPFYPSLLTLALVGAVVIFGLIVMLLRPFRRQKKAPKTAT